jgi:UDP-glucose:(heptosyl)LPS alpha-1,3-glucosyltransferase
MNIALCYESVLPSRGGCETYITDLSRRLLQDRHQVHLYACQWDERALPGVTIHAVPRLSGPRFLRPWRFGQRCLAALAGQHHDVTVGFDKTWGQDVLYPQGGLHAASVEHNYRKQPSPALRALARGVKWLDIAHWSYTLLERKQYLGERPPLIVVNSHMVREHFQRYYEISAGQLHVVRSAIDADRFPEHDRLRRRQEWRDRWALTPHHIVGLFAAMNYRLKGLEPLLYAVGHLCAARDLGPRAEQLRLVIAGSPRYERYERLARRLGIEQRVRFVGHCAEMRNGYFAADFLVHPTFYDPCSLVVLEALACGLPVITTRYNGASELLQSEREGFVIDDPHDHARLAWCVSQLLEPGRRHACGQAARVAAQHCTFEDHYQQLMDVFAEAARRKRAA